MKLQFWARVQNNQIVQGPLVLPENFFSKDKKNTDQVAQAIALNWLPVIDNSQEIDSKKMAISTDYALEILPDKIIKTHRTKPFPIEFVEAYDQFLIKNNLEKNAE